MPFFFVFLGLVFFNPPPPPSPTPFSFFNIETLTKRQATQHGCLPSLLCDGDKGIEIVNGEEKKIVEQPRLDKSLLYQHDKPKESAKEGPLSFVLFESPSTSVSTCQQGPPLSCLSNIEYFYKKNPWLKVKNGDRLQVADLLRMAGYECTVAYVLLGVLQIKKNSYLLQFTSFSFTLFCFKNNQIDFFLFSFLVPCFCSFTVAVVVEDKQ